MTIGRRQMLQMLAMGIASAGLRLPTEAPRRRSLVLVTNSEGNEISLIDLDRLKPAGDWQVGDRPHGIALPQSGKVVYTTIETEKALKSIDASSGKVMSTLALPGRPNQCAVTPNGKFVAVGATLTFLHDLEVARFSGTGLADSTFGSGGVLTTKFGVDTVGTAAIVQPDGKIVVAAATTVSGQDGLALVRYFGD